ncbi:MAG: hypothetical protein JSU67_16555 [Gammaproteobacteria bacterium]|nr:MAG: hypothetical protein JSU67_16555 [Gammaproteobacteria bacterium]
MEDVDRYRCRHIYLKQSNNPALQAKAACAALANLDGILLAAPHSEHCVHIVYSLDQLTIEIVIELLGELNFEMDNTFLRSLRNTIYTFLEENARDNLHIENTEGQQDNAENHEIPHQDNDQYWEDYH